MIDLNKLLRAIEAFYKKALRSELIIKAQSNHDSNAAKSKKEQEDEADKWLKRNDPGAKYRVETPSEEEEEEVELTPPSIKPASNEAPSLYSTIISFAKQIKNDDVAEQLKKIAELYKEAIENKKGYSLVSSAISRFLENALVDNYSDYDDEDDVEPGEEDITPEQAAKLEGQNIETLLSTVYGDINNRFAKQRDAEKGFKDPEITSPEKEEEPEETDYVGPAGLGTGIDAGDIGGKRAPEDGKMSSMHVTDIRTPKDWVKSYQDDMIRCINQLKDPALTDKMRAGLKEQIEVLKKLVLNAGAELKILEDGSISWIVIPKTDVSPRRKIPSDSSKQAEYEAIKSEQKVLRVTNNAIKTKIRTFSILQKNNVIEARMARTRFPKEKFLLEQQKQLNNLIASKDVGKTEEIKARRNLIKLIEGGATSEQIENHPDLLPNLNPDQLKIAIKKIEEAAAKKIPFEIYDEKRKLKYTKQRQSLYQYYGEKSNIRGKALELTGLIKQFVESLSSIKMGLKKNITAKLKADENTKYKPYKDAIAAAVAIGDIEGEKRSTKALMVVLNAEAEAFPQIMKFVEYSKPFKDCLDKVILIDASEKAGKPSPINIPDLIGDIDRLLMMEKGRSAKSKLGEALAEIKLKLENSLPKTRVVIPEEPQEDDPSQDIEDTTEKLKRMMLPSPKQGTMNRKQRKTALTKLTKTALLDTSLDAKVNAITSSLSHIKDPQAHADAAFDAILDSIVIKGLE